MSVIGYVTPRSFEGFVIPVPAQSLCLREFAKSQKLNFILPRLEFYFEDCYMQLFSLIKIIDEGDILAMYSASMLPLDIDKLKYFFSELESKNAKVHFVLEAKTIKNFDEARTILFSYSLKNMFDKMYQIDISDLRNFFK